MGMVFDDLTWGFADLNLIVIHVTTTRQSSYTNHCKTSSEADTSGDNILALSDTWETDEAGGQRTGERENAAPLWRYDCWGRTTRRGKTTETKSYICMLVSHFFIFFLSSFMFSLIFFVYFSGIFLSFIYLFIYLFIFLLCFALQQKV